MKIVSFIKTKKQQQQQQQQKIQERINFFKNIN